MKEKNMDLKLNTKKYATGNLYFINKIKFF